ncbi:hypothetical protein [Nocardioides zeae]
MTVTSTMPPTTTGASAARGAPGEHPADRDRQRGQHEVVHEDADDEPQGDLAHLRALLAPQQQPRAVRRERDPQRAQQQAGGAHVRPPPAA